MSARKKVAVRWSADAKAENIGGTRGERLPPSYCATLRRNGSEAAHVFGDTAREAVARTRRIARLLNADGAR